MISALPWTTSASSLNSPTSSSRKATRRRDASNRTSRRSGRAIFRGTPGNPAPVPTSIMRSPGRAGKAVRQAKKITRRAKGTLGPAAGGAETPEAGGAGEGEKEGGRGQEKDTQGEGQGRGPGTARGGTNKGGALSGGLNSLDS